MPQHTQYARTLMASLPWFHLLRHHSWHHEQEHQAEEEAQKLKAPLRSHRI